MTECYKQYNKCYVGTCQIPSSQAWMAVHTNSVHHSHAQRTWLLKLVGCASQPYPTNDFLKLTKDRFTHNGTNNPEKTHLWAAKYLHYYTVC